MPRYPHLPPSQLPLHGVAYWSTHLIEVILGTWGARLQSLLGILCVCYRCNLNLNCDVDAAETRHVSRHLLSRISNKICYVHKIGFARKNKRQADLPEEDRRLDVCVCRCKMQRQRVVRYVRVLGVSV